MIKQRAKKDSTIFKTSFLINLLLTFVLTLAAVYLIYNLSQDSEIATFDPYEILGIDRNVDNKGIKSAYRRKSLKFHPDKNPDNPAAEATFMLIAKAYEALTDETAKANWEKYGNPDGKQVRNGNGRDDDGQPACQRQPVSYKLIPLTQQSPPHSPSRSPLVSPPSSSTVSGST